MVIGDALRLRQAADILGLDADIQAIENVEDAVYTPGRVNVIDLALLPEDLPWGQLSPWPGTPRTSTSGWPASWRWRGKCRPSAPRRSTRRRCTPPGTSSPGTPSCWRS
ncbi:hypothetical protein PJ267_08970 [Arthrobacter sp. OVS8]|nr:hypothetical protein PJ267_08970 [Arthrobacter sp. OVS8]